MERKSSVGEGDSKVVLCRGNGVVWGIGNGVYYPVKCGGGGARRRGIGGIGVASPSRGVGGAICGYGGEECVD